MATFQSDFTIKKTINIYEMFWVSNLVGCNLLILKQLLVVLQLLVVDLLWYDIDYSSLKQYIISEVINLTPVI